MNKAEKIRKLGNAVRSYRGRFWNLPEGKIKWVETPQPHKMKRILELLALLQFDQEEQDSAVFRIDGFKSIDEFHVWIKAI